MPHARRLILRSPQVAARPSNSRRLRQQQQLDKERAALDRWMGKLTRACSAIRKQQRRIARLERRLACADHP